MRKAIKQRQTSLPKQPGEQGRLKVVKGPDVGCIFVLLADAVSLGRGEENDVVITDLKASRLHAELKKSPQGWTLTDMGSANGVMVGGVSTRKGQLTDGDLFSIGETTFEFFSNRAGTQFITAPPKSEVLLQQERQAQKLQQDRLVQMTTPGGLKQLADSWRQVGAGNQKRLPLILAAAVAIGVLLFWESTPTAPPMGKAKSKGSRDLATYLPGNSTPAAPETRQNADLFFKMGFREFRERNFLRARVNFETALQVDPSHRLSQIYLHNCDLEIREEVAFHLDKGAKMLQAGRLRESKGHFESVTRLLFRDQSNPAFVESQEQLRMIRTAMRKLASEPGSDNGGAQ